MDILRSLNFKIQSRNDSFFAKIVHFVVVSVLVLGCEL